MAASALRPAIKSESGDLTEDFRSWDALVASRHVQRPIETDDKNGYLRGIKRERRFTMGFFSLPRNAWKTRVKSMYGCFHGDRRPGRWNERNRSRQLLIFRFKRGWDKATGWK